jgi:hypothetical protein
LLLSRAFRVYRGLIIYCFQAIDFIRDETAILFLAAYVILGAASYFQA